MGQLHRGHGHRRSLRRAARPARELAISFAHELVADRSVVRGEATSRVEERDGTIALIEEFTKDGAAHESVCLQV